MKKQIYILKIKVKEEYKKVITNQNNIIFRMIEVG